MDEVIDEDIEALLYAQVYYGKSDTAQPAVVPNQVENLPNNDETVSGKIQETDKVPEEQIQDTNLSSKEHQDENEGRPVNLEESQDRACDPNSDKPVSNPTHKTGVLEKQDEFVVEPNIHPLSQSEVSQQQYIQISTPATDTIQTEKEPVQTAPLLAETSNASNQQPLDNITINQYICPGKKFLNRLKNFRKTIVWCNKCEHHLRQYQKGKLSERDFFVFLRNKCRSQKAKLKKQQLLKEQQKKIRKTKSKQQKTSTPEIICLSDSDNSDLEIVGVESQSVAMKKTKNDSASTKKMESTSPTIVEDSSEDDDAIIYVEPPPVPVINVDDGSESEVEASKEATAEIQDDASNDFLAPTNTSEQFNFSLHGSEFQNADFVRPTDPTDAYETESSTTTSDFNKESNRDFSNSVNTIVFDEVDFPREDIFEGSNLDKFGELITPQRGHESNLNKIEEVQVDHNTRKPKRLNPRTSSESSSESEYDARETHSNLPDLSPMIGVSTSPKKNSKSKTKPTQENATKDKQPELKSRSNKKSKQIFSGDDDGILDANGSENTTNNLHKKRSLGVVVDSPKKKIKKKKTADKDVEEQGDTMDETMAAETSNILFTSTPKRSGKELAELSIEQPESSKKKNKKKKKQAKIAEDNNSDVNEEETASSVDTNKTKFKKRKVSSKMADQSTVLENTSVETIEPLTPIEKDGFDDGSKKKAKKRKGRLSSVKETTSENVQAPVTAENEVTVEASEVLVSEQTGKRKNKRDKQNSSNKANDNDVTENIEDANQQSNEQSINMEEESLDPLKMPEETHSGEKELGEIQGDEEDVLIIEQAVPVHTIESSDSEDGDIKTFDDLSDELKLANITSEISVPNYPLDKFDIEYAKSKMSDDPDKWKILSVDKYNITITKKGPRCKRCRQYGHLAVNCTNKPPIPSCTLCGYEGHQEPRCPNKVCFTCGKPGNYSTVFCHKCVGHRGGKCYLCKLKGHSAKFCPDLWRRYYLTIKEGPLITPKWKKQTVIPRSKQWCSGCASKGHLEFECDSYKWIREYPTSSPYIFDYRDVYETEKKKNRLHGSDLRNILLQNRSRNNRSIDKDYSQVVDQEDKTRNISVETSAEATATVDHETGNHVEESTNTEISQPSNDREVLLTTEISVDNTTNLAEHPNQDEATHQPVSSTPEPTHNPQEMIRWAKNRKLRRREKLNPLSMLKPPVAPMKFTPYQSVLNPCSVLGTASVDSLNVVPPNYDIGTPFIDTVGASADNSLQNVPAYSVNFAPSNQDVGPTFVPAYNLNHVPLNHDVNPTFIDAMGGQAENVVQNTPALGLFNQIPSNLLAQQVANLMNAFSGYQQPNQMQYDFTQANTYQGPDYNAQVQSSRYNWRDMNYFDVPQPIPEQGYFDNMRGQGDREFTHTNYETNYMESNRPYHRDAWTDEHFRDRNYAGRNTPHRASSLTTVPLDTLDTYKPKTLDNIEERITIKFTTATLSALRTFIRTELNMLKKAKNVPTKEYKTKLSSIDQLKKVHRQTKTIKKQIYTQYKHINMYLFGLRKLADGNDHLNFLGNFVRSPGRFLRESKRNALLNSYGYIFGGAHPNFNYRKYLNALTVDRGR